MRIATTLAITILAAAAHAADPALTGGAAKIYEQARTGSRFFSDAAKLKPDIRATSDNRSYSLIWKNSAAPGK